ncbi:energy transducer TonB [Pelomonas sp. SE-A7]|uniref:energy transducer TonB n=1 Tax=Pelomonas sp. SE-A7 TaxID=3054953 RepID=UPI00259CD328|nr:energy transducer TonB [Pelomonas sp. SE-A7]MDM4767049.1 TonB family protein [Pelomonas sp. SE-A7]
MSHTLAMPVAFGNLPTMPEALAESPRRRLALVVLVLHVLFFWALMQQELVQKVVQKAKPIVVSLIASPEPPKPVVKVSLPQPPMPQIQVLHVPVPEVQIQAPIPTPTVTVAPPPPAPPQAQVVNPVVTPTPVQQPPVQPSIKTLPSSAVRYLVEPRLIVPTLSRRLGEQGIVYLRVIVDTRGQPREITIKKSSGFARIDQQALADMRSARFVPQTENGQAIEWEVVAPLSYELER